MSATAVTSAVNHRRIQRARAWLESRELAEEVVIVGASLDAANELGRRVAKEKGAAFGCRDFAITFRCPSKECDPMATSPS